MDIKQILKDLCKENGITFKDLAILANMNTNGLHDKCRRKSLTVKDLEKLLQVLGKEIKIVDKK